MGIQSNLPGSDGGGIHGKIGFGRLEAPHFYKFFLMIPQTNTSHECVARASQYYPCARPFVSAPNNPILISVISTVKNIRPAQN
jgi:hypothetical protein